jgi:sugar O-acyltransferase (sialic acid O-acetyltransferase NeuD family)
MPANLRVSKPADFVDFRPDSILQGIHQRIEEQVPLNPAALAVHTGEVAYSYAGLNGHANSVANSILSRCGQGLAQAAILLPNTPEMVVAMLAALKAHKAYVPLDCNYPLDRLRTMFEDAEPSVLLTDGAHLGLAEELARKRVPVIDTSLVERHADAPNPNIVCDPLDRAYILYTSGSTGRPKGIVFLHRNLLHTTMCLTNQLFFSPSDRITWLHSASFAASVVDIYCGLCNGATIYPWDPKVRGFNGMAQWLVGQKLTTLQSIPSAFRQFLRTVPESLRFQDIRIVVMASEPLTIGEVELFRRHFSPGSHLVNQLGTSESYNYNLHVVDHQVAIEGVNVPGGYPVSPDRKVLILDQDHKDADQGCTGEIAIKSAYMSGGYWHDDALTRTRFIRTGDDDAPVFLTGDLGRIEADGCLTHLGRKDFQIKIRGYRIEIAEVERVLMRARDIADCACWVAKNQAGEDQLVGYVILRSPGQFDRREIERYLEKYLPGYMVPRTYVLLDCLPTLPSGKTDRKALPNPFTRTGSQQTLDGVPVSSVERRLVDIFKDLLQLDQVSPETDFLHSGGDSLSVAVLSHRIHQCFEVDIPLGDFVESLTPARLAALIAAPPARGNRYPAREQSGNDCQFTPSIQPAPSPSSEIARGKPCPGASARGRCGIAGKNLVIIGAGQLGREVLAWATQIIASGGLFRIKGFLDDNAGALKGYDYEPHLLGDVLTYNIDINDVFVSAIGNPIARAKCCSRIERRGGQFINLIHPLANIGLHVDLGVGIVMGPFASVTCDVRIGNHTSIGALSNVGHDAVLGNWCQVGSHCGLNGCATLGDGAFLGSHACILPGVKVGPWAFVGAGSVVVRDVAARVKVFGNPASPIGKVCCA